MWVILLSLLRTRPRFWMNAPSPQLHAGICIYLHFRQKYSTTPCFMARWGTSLIKILILFLISGILTATGQQLTRLLFVFERARVRANLCFTRLPTVKAICALDNLKPIIIPEPCSAPDSAATCPNYVPALTQAAPPNHRAAVQKLPPLIIIIASWSWCWQ